MQENEEVAVVMSTYNGEKWIKEQLDSIINQTYKNIKIFFTVKALKMFKSYFEVTL